MNFVQCWTCPVDVRRPTVPVEVISDGKRVTARMCLPCKEKWKAHLGTVQGDLRLERLQKS
jgi:hypothetical protein